MSPNGHRFELIYHGGMVYEGWIGFRFIIMHKDVLVIVQDCIGDSE